MDGISVKQNNVFKKCFYKRAMYLTNMNVSMSKFWTFHKVQSSFCAQSN